MAASTGGHLENIKSQYLKKNKNPIFMQFASNVQISKYF